jgi:mannosyltransferase
MSISLRKADQIFSDKMDAIFIKSNVGITVILVLAIFLRFYALDRQSLWLDELHTMNEASPNLSFSELFHYLTCCDQHPPLYYFIEKLLFSIFGYTSLVARCLSAALGVASVLVMYFLGKELSGKKLGLIASAFTAINYYNIEYSQEVRSYIMAFFFAALTFVFFFRLIKAGGRKNIWLYGLSALGVIYSHYYGLFLVTGEYVAAFIFWIIGKSDRKRLFQCFFFSSIIFIVGYLPWLPVLKEMSQIKSFWAGQIKLDFISIYFFDYFGDYLPLNPFLLLALIYFFYCFIRRAIPWRNSIKSSPVLLCFVTFSIIILVAIGIPTVRSILVVPMLVERYTIIIVPAIILIISFAFYLIPSSLLRSLLFTVFLILSLNQMIVVNKFYTRLRKTQFRELTEYIMKDSAANKYPIINERTAWHIQYYLDHYHYTGKLLVGQKEAIVDSILSKSSQTYDLAAFWIMGAHGNEKKISNFSQSALDTAYTLVKDKNFFDAWVQLYISKKQVDSASTIRESGPVKN